VSAATRRKGLGRKGVPTDNVPANDPGDGAVPPEPRSARSSSEPGEVVVVLPDKRLTPDEVEAIAQRLAALLLRAP
jgi:hypothetical protein